MRPPRNHIIVGDARTALAALPAASVDAVVTSPPYFKLRHYFHDDQIGMETSVDGWVDELRTVLRGIARVLKPSGSLWLNLGDTYSRGDRDGAGPKSLLLGPERLALALLEDGWIIRSKIVWAKTNPMPTSVRDRFSCTHELIYFAVRSPRYYFDLDAIRVPHRSQLNHPSASAARRALDAVRPEWAGPLAGSNSGLDRTKAQGRVGHPLGKNPGDVWQFATSSHGGFHHATFPTTLITRPILATCPERLCTRCGTPWKQERSTLAATGPLHPACTCAAAWRPGLVLDPFMGAGTTAVVAEQHHRDWLGVELNPDFAAAASTRIDGERIKRRSGHGSARGSPMAA